MNTQNSTGSLLSFDQVVKIDSASAVRIAVLLALVALVLGLGIRLFNK